MNIFLYILIPSCCYGSSIITQEDDTSPTAIPQTELENNSGQTRESYQTRLNALETFLEDITQSRMSEGSDEVKSGVVDHKDFIELALAAGGEREILMIWFSASGDKDHIVEILYDMIRETNQALEE